MSIDLIGLNAGFLRPVALAAFAALFTVLPPVAARVHRRLGIVARNFRGDVIPSRVGTYLWLVTAIYAALFHRLDGPDLAALTAVAAAGWLDDAFGANTSKGIRGHLRQSFRQRRPTTGLVKALAITFVSLALAFRETSSPWTAVTCAAAIALSGNAVNLLDVRPGRALKGFFALALPALMFAAAQSSERAAEALSVMFPVLVGALALFPGDLKGRWMLGDTGANFLGVAAGMWIVRFAPEWYVFIVVSLLAALHWFAERRSLTRIIERFHWLDWLDRLGQKPR